MADTSEDIANQTASPSRRLLADPPQADPPQADPPQADPPQGRGRDATPEPVAAALRQPAAASGSGKSPAPVKLLLVAAITGISYRVLRCAAACGAEVTVIGNLGARGLALSRYCERFVLSHAIINGGFDAGLALEINCLARELGVAMVLPADAPSTRALIACRHLLRVPCFPLPDLEQFDLLNDKWRFAGLCDALGIRHPATRLFPDIDALEAALAAGGIDPPVVVKALSLAGSQGLIVLDGHDSEARLKQVNYRPILVQRFIPGRDIGASVYCQDGKVTAFIAHELRRRVYRTFRGDAILRDIERIAAHVGAEGVYNFDMIETDAGEIYYLECNPRFFFKINLSMLAGINFIAPGLRGTRDAELARVPDGAVVRAPEASLTAPGSWLKLTRRDWAAARYVMADPIYYLAEELGLLL